MKSKGLRVEDPASYRIQIQGALDPQLSGRLGGMDIQAQRFEDMRMPVTILSGRLRDQAALFGVLNALYDLRLPVLSVEYLE
jgi:hypothetical protein